MNNITAKSYLCKVAGGIQWVCICDDFINRPHFINSDLNTVQDQMKEWLLGRNINPYDCNWPVNYLSKINPETLPSL
jgi:hypothetical protein